MPIVFLEINSLITFFLQNPSSSAVGIRTAVIGCSAVDSYPIPVFWHRARPPNMDTHGFGQKKYQKKGLKNRKKGWKSCQEYQWYMNYWPSCPGFQQQQKKHSTPEIPAWSPTAVLIGPNGAWLRSLDGMRYIHHGVIEWWDLCFCDVCRAENEKKIVQ